VPRERNKGETPEEKRLVTLMRESSQDASSYDIARGLVESKTKVELVYEPQDFVRGDDLPEWTKPAVEAGVYFQWCDNQGGSGDIQEVLSRTMKTQKSGDVPGLTQESADKIYAVVNRSATSVVANHIPDSEIDDTLGCVVKRHPGNLIEFLVYADFEWAMKDKGWPAEMSRARYRQDMKTAQEKGGVQAADHENPDPVDYVTYSPVGGAKDSVTAADVVAAGGVPGSPGSEGGVQVELGPGQS
jgi:hypothetical protein